MNLEEFLIKMRRRGYGACVIDNCVSEWSLEFGEYADDIVGGDDDDTPTVIGSGRTIQAAIKRAEADYQKEKKRGVA